MDKEELDMDKRLYIAIIADIIGSRNIKERNTVQKHLENVLERINETYQYAIASQFIITLGDEFQGVLHSGAVMMRILDRIQREMHPIAFRFGIGMGTLSVALQADTSLGSDGSAFHLARACIDAVQVLESKKAESKTNMLIGIEGNEHTSSLLNTIFKLSWALQASWTLRQREIIGSLQQFNETQAEIAKRLGIVQSSVQKSLASSQYYTYKEATTMIGHTLQVLTNEQT
ncbi:MAG TPA: SatD family protein [Sphaerochaeta sp.]|nr:SatD family protein [Sphaerochaeta sp.]